LVHGTEDASVMALMWRLGVFDIVGSFGTAHGDTFSS
jgi:hypothetical protein